MNFDFPLNVSDEMIENDHTGKPERVLVYLLNGHDNYGDAKPVWRRPIKRGNVWYVRDHGLVRLLGASDAEHPVFTT